MTSSIMFRRAVLADLPPALVCKPVTVYLPDVQVPDGCELPGELLVSPEAASGCPSCGGVGRCLESCKASEDEVPVVTISRASGYDDVKAWAGEGDHVSTWIERGRRQVAMSWDDKPSAEMRKALKLAGFGWQKRAKVWLHKCWGDVPSVKAKILAELAEKASPKAAESAPVERGPMGGPAPVEKIPSWAYSDVEAEESAVLATSDYHGGAEYLRSGGW